MDAIEIRDATEADQRHLRVAVVVRQDYERALHATRLPGEDIADAYVGWLTARAREAGATLVAEVGGAFAGFAAGWVEDAAAIGESAGSNRYGYVSDACVLEPFRGRRLAAMLLLALESRLRGMGISRMRVNALATNVAAEASYQRAGYAPYEIVYEKLVGAADRG